MVILSHFFGCQWSGEVNNKFENLVLTNLIKFVSNLTNLMVAHKSKAVLNSYCKTFFLNIMYHCQLIVCGWSISQQSIPHKYEVSTWRPKIYTFVAFKFDRGFPKKWDKMTDKFRVGHKEISKMLILHAIQLKNIQNVQKSLKHSFSKLFGNSLLIFRNSFTERNDWRKN